VWAHYDGVFGIVQAELIHQYAKVFVIEGVHGAVEVLLGIDLVAVQQAVAVEHWLGTCRGNEAVVAEGALNVVLGYFLKYPLAYEFPHGEALFSELDFQAVEDAAGTGFILYDQASGVEVFEYGAQHDRR